MELCLCTPIGKERAAEEIKCCHLKTIKVVGSKKDYEEHYRLVKVVRNNIETAKEPVITINGTAVLYH
jgi:3-dehydroquinate dehydratase